MAEKKKIGKMTVWLPTSHDEFDTGHINDCACIKILPEDYCMTFDDTDADHYGSDIVVVNSDADLRGAKVVEEPDDDFFDPWDCDDDVMPTEYRIRFDKRDMTTSELREMMTDSAEEAERLCDAWHDDDEKGVRDAIRDLPYIDGGHLTSFFEGDVPDTLYIVDDKRLGDDPMMFSSRGAFEKWYAEEGREDGGTSPVGDIAGFEVSLAADGRNGYFLDYIHDDMELDTDFYLLYCDDTGSRWFMPTTHEARDVGDDLDAAESREIGVEEAAELLVHDLQNSFDGAMALPLPANAPRDFYAGLVGDGDGRMLAKVPEKMRDEGMCVAAVNEDGLALQYVPEGLRSHEICLAAVNGNGLALQYVPEGLRSHEICLAAVTRDENALMALRYVPAEFRDREIYEAVMKEVGTLRCVPESDLCRELCLAAVRHRGWDLENVPKYLRDSEMCLAAVMEDGKALRYVPEELRDEEMYLEAVRHNAWALEYIPQEHRDHEMCEIALKSDARLWRYVPKAVRAGAESPEEFLARTGEDPEEAHDAKM